MDDSGKFTGIIDWGQAGFSLKEREYIGAKLRARYIPSDWREYVELMFSEDSKGVFEIFLELDRELVRYSGM